MESTLLGLVLDSSPLIAAERMKQPVIEFIAGIFQAHGEIELSLSPVTVAELVHGIYRAKTRQAALQRRTYVEEVLALVPVHLVSSRTGWLVGQIQGQEAAKGNILPFNDLMIAVSAMEQGYGVLTANMRHFQKIPGLKVIRQI